MSGRHDNTSEERLRRVLDTDAVGVLFLDYSGTLIDANDAFLKMTGYTREQVTSKSLHWRDVTPPEYISAREAQLRASEARLTKELSDTLLEHALAEDVLHEKANWLRSQREALESAVKGAPLPNSLEPLVRTVVETLGEGARAAFYLANDDGTKLHQVIGMGDEQVNELPIGPESLACGLATDTDGCWSFPINTAAGNFVGTLAMYLPQPQTPTSRELELASLITNIASIVISRHTESEVRNSAEAALRESEVQTRSLNEELEERVRDRTHELEAEVHERRAAEERVKNLLRRLVNVEEQERRRIARELHDTFGQQLAALHMNIEVLKSKVSGDAIVRESMDRMRETFDRLNSSVDFLAWELRPPSLDLLGLDAAMESYVKEWSQQFGVEAVYAGVAVSGLRLAAEAEINLYRIFQEALQNIHKHANADRVNVVFERRDGHAVLIVEDDGEGYDAEAQVQSGRGMGLISMQERAALIGGIVEIESQSGEGTTVYVKVPVSEHRHE